MNKNRVIEVLSPAKNLQCGIEAIKCGADSVYIACEKLGLRKGCSNSLKDVKKLCDFAHKYWVKVYVTVNSTIHTDEDLVYAQDMINQLYEIGVDAIIISDMGILTFDLPPIPIFASVNTCCFTPEKIKFLEKIGISRVILPRELTFEEIKNISEQTSIELEVFIHGTFCVGISGYCFLKYGQTIKNSNKNKELNKYQQYSANSGACPALCYDKYNLYDANDNCIVENDHILRLPFMDLMENIGKYAETGVHSFKIEGRQRRLNYVKNATALCNQEANKYIKDSNTNLRRLSSGTSVIDFSPALDKIYNRGYTDYFFNGRKKENLNITSTFGKFIGKVIEQDNNSFKIDNDIKLSIGDKILYQQNDKRTGVFDIIDIKDDMFFYSIENVDILNCDLYRILNAKEEENIENAKAYRYISAEMTVERKDDLYFFNLIDEDEIETSVEYNINANSEMTMSQFVDLFNEDVEIGIKVLKLNSEENICLDTNDVYKIRDILCAALIEKRIQNRPIETGHINKNSTEKYPEEITYLDNVCNKKSVEFYKQHGIEEPELGLETSKDIEGKRIYAGKYCIRFEQGYCSKLKRKDTPPLPWTIEDKYNNKYQLEFDCKNCKMYILY